MKTHERPQTADRRPQTLSDGAKIAACWFVACLLTVGVLSAADITGGYTFSSGEKNVTHTKLNSLGAGTINTTFVTDKTAQTAVGADSLIYYASADAGFRKTTLTTLFNNAPAINGLSTLNSVGNFSVNTDKFTANATTGNTAVGGNLTVATNLTVTGNTVLTGTLWVTGAVQTVSTLQPNGLFTAAAGINWIGHNKGTLGGTFYVPGASTNAGDTYLGDAAGDTINLIGTLAGTLQGTPTVTLTAKSSIVGADSLLISDSAASSVLKSVIVSNLVRSATAQSYVPGASSTVTLAHNLGGIPQSYRLALVCTNADAASGYAAGDEVDGSLVSEGAANPQPLFLPRIEGTNVVVVRQSAANSDIHLIPKTGGAWATITDITNFNVKIYAVRFP